ncbi:MAG: ABC transporter ATP-binding protein [Spirochaetaceae bacterium]|jgi:iron complex transport system ATP-binding protein|nr:ABC transporter ATP-binding protein [Spirochaetaceae bacterium]
MVAVHDVCAGYNGVEVIHHISFNAKAGESLCIVGPNGCGKSTLLKSIAHIIAYRGQVTLEGRSVTSFSRKELAKNIALLAQVSQIFFPYTVRETVALGRYAYTSGFLKNLSAEDEAITSAVLKRLDLWELQNRMIDELSGGQLQRVFLAKTLAQNPAVILLDEPTNHLDLKNQIELLTFLKTWARENNKTFIGVFHDLNLVRHFGDAVILMNSGTIAAAGKPGDVLAGETLHAVYGLDIQGFMLESLEKWRNARD